MTTEVISTGTGPRTQPRAGPGRARSCAPDTTARRAAGRQAPGRPEASCAQRGGPSRACESLLKARHEDMLRAAASHPFAAGVRRARATVTAIPHPAIIWAVAAETVLTPCSRRIHPGHGGRQRGGRPSPGSARPR
jgi:hypothetical protein